MDDLREEAARWLARLDTGTADAAAFAAWRDRDPRHAVAYAQALAAWERMGTAGALESSGEMPRPVSRRALLRAAAVAIPVAVGGPLLWQGLSDAAHAATGPGEQRRLEIASGITVMLNAESEIAWKVAADECELRFRRGEAAIAIERQVARTVMLHCGRRRIELQPGDYNVRAEAGDSAELLVLHGAARSQEGRGAPTVARGQQLHVDADHAEIVPAPPIAAINAAAWQRGEIVFDGQTLEEAIAEYNRTLSRKLRIDDPAVGALRIGGRFDLFRPQAFLASVKSSFGLDAEPVGDAVVLKRNAAVR